MKTTFKTLIVLIALFYFQSSYAQVFNWSSNGNSPASGDFLGSTNTNPLELKTTNTGTPQPINFYTNNTPRMTLSSGGSLGIGLTVPSRRLDVLDAGNPQLRLTQTAGANFTDFQTTSAGNLLIAPSNGNVGIGTANPKSLLDVNGTVTAKQVLISYGKTTQDLLAMIVQLQTEVNELKKQLTASKN